MSSIASIATIGVLACALSLHAQDRPIGKTGPIDKPNLAETATRRIVGAPPPRPSETKYDATFGIRITSKGGGKGMTAVTVIPMEWPEQKLELLSERIYNGKARVERVGDGGSVLILRTQPLAAGEVAYAIREYRITVKTIGRDWKSGDFPEKRPAIDKSARPYLGSSPGIQSTDSTIQKLAKELTAEKTTDLEKLTAIFQWVHREIEYKEMKFTSAKAAVINRVGDCEERASAFIALTRASGIPARTVWTPGHCWAEFYLADNDGTGHWLPAHTTNPPWFGCLGSKSVVLQKGDSFRPPEWKGVPKRLLSSWYKGVEPKPNVEFIQEIKPVSANSKKE